MTLAWIVEDGVFGEDLDPLLKAIKRQDMQAEVVKYLAFQAGKYDDIYPPDNCVLCYGSVGLIRQLMQQTHWVPGAWCTLKNLECSSYYAHYGEHLLNDDYIMLPLGEVLRRKDEIYGMYCKDVEPHSVIFIRPNSGVKSFTGHALEYRHVDREIKWCIDMSSPELIVVISSAKKIHREWRFIAAHKEIVAGSLYKMDNELTLSSDFPQAAFDFASLAVQNDWEPDPMFAIDICEVEGELFVLEMNSFSSSGFYRCDPDAIVAKAGELAEEEWNDLYENY